MDLTGKDIGAYEVWGPISQGGMSRVWLARHRELSMPVVIKTLIDAPAKEADSEGEITSPREPPNTAAFAQLRNEARLMARVPNPAVVRAVDVGVHAGLPYLVQEYVDGLDLAELDNRRRTALHRGFPLWFVCRVINQVGGALESAHQMGVLHRDIKPSNLFGAPQTGVRLGDFGIAMGRDRAGEASSGTLRFMAPEAIAGKPPTKRCDVYSLGATAYDLYYGSPPFPDLASIAGGEPARFPEARSPEEAYFQHVLAKMLERDPELRFPSLKAPRRLLAPLGRGLRPKLPGMKIDQAQFQIGPVRVICRMGDIADAEVDGIVNSAHDDLTMITGVGASLKAKGGQIIEDEAQTSVRRALGECFATTGGALRCKKVLHAVSAWKEASCIARAAQRVFLLADELNLRSLAIPALGTGRAHVSPESSAYATASALYWHVLVGGSRLSRIELVLYDRAMLDVFIEELSDVLIGGVDQPSGSDEAAVSERDVALDETIQLDTFSRLRG